WAWKQDGSSAPFSTGLPWRQTVGRRRTVLGCRTAISATGHRRAWAVPGAAARRARSAVPACGYAASVGTEANSLGQQTDATAGLLLTGGNRERSLRADRLAGNEPPVALLTAEANQGQFQRQAKYLNDLIYQDGN